MTLVTKSERDRTFHMLYDRSIADTFLLCRRCEDQFSIFFKSLQCSIQLQIFGFCNLLTWQSKQNTKLILKLKTLKNHYHQNSFILQKFNDIQDEKKPSMLPSVTEICERSDTILIHFQWRLWIFCLFTSTKSVDKYCFPRTM